MIRIKPFALIAITALTLIVALGVSSLPYGKFSAVNGVWAQQYGPPSSDNLQSDSEGLTGNQGHAVGHLTFNMDQAFTFKPLNIPLNHLVVYRLTPNGDLQLVPQGTTPGPGGYWVANSDGSITLYGTGGGGIQGKFYFFNFPNPATAPKTIFK